MLKTLSLDPVLNYFNPFHILILKKFLHSILIIVQRDATKTVYLLFCKFSLHVSGVNHTHHQEYTKL